LSKIFDFGGAKRRRKKDALVANFKGRACKLDFPALHESKFAAYFTRWQILGPE